jgi:uncharacterized protein (TIGR03435 family)
VILNHLWQSSLFTAAVMLVAFALRHNRADVRRRLWLAASVKFLIPFALFTTIGTQFHWEAAERVIATPVYTTVAQWNEPFATEDSPSIPSHAQSNSSRHRVALLLFALWCVGAMASLASWFIRWCRLNKIVHAAEPIGINSPIKAVRCRDRIEPGVFGLFRPVVLIPADIQDRLSAEQFEAVIAHELQHARHRDNLALTLHMIVESLFWFHPLVWWIRVRLVEEQERACDESVIGGGRDPQIYAESIVKICDWYVRAPAGVSGVSGADLKRRITEIMRNRSAVRLSWLGVILLAGSAAITVGIPVLISVLHASPVPQQQPRQEFEAVSIRPSDPSAASPAGMRGGGGGPCSAGPPQIDPAHFTISNITLYNLIGLAYGQNTCMRWVKYGMLSGGPDWIRSQKFTIQAAMPEGFPKYSFRQLIDGDAQRLQAMLQSLLETRFKLRFHREQKEASLYELSPAKDGVKLNWEGRDGSEGIRLTRDGDCDDVDPFGSPPSGSQPLRSFCGSRLLTFAGSPAHSWLLTMTAATSGQLASMLELSLDRPVLDKTGIKGKINLRVTFAFDDNTPPPAGAPAELAIEPDPNMPSIFTALQQKLGLKLVATKAPIEIIVVDHAERPVN